MLNKLRLDQTKRFERHLALEEITNMLLHFFKGNASYLSIGAEQGSIDKWDDFVIEKMVVAIFIYKLRGKQRVSPLMQL